MKHCCCSGTLALSTIKQPLKLRLIAHLSCLHSTDNVALLCFAWCENEYLCLVQKYKSLLLIDLHLRKISCGFFEFTHTIKLVFLCRLPSFSIVSRRCLLFCDFLLCSLAWYLIYCKCSLSFFKLKHSVH